MALWTPALISTAVWFDAADSDTVTLTSGAVSTWTDKSGNNRNAGQSDSSFRPTYHTDVLNGLPIVRFDGSNDRMDFSTGIASAAPLTVCCVYRRASTGIRSFPLGADSTGNPYPLWWDTDNISYSNLGTSGFNTHGSANTTVGGVLDAITRTSTGVILYRFGSIVGTEQSATGSANLTRIGGRSNVFHSGDIGEIVITLNTDNLKKIEGYLAHKWGLAGHLPSNHPYKDAAPIHTTVSGIVTDELGNPVQRKVYAMTRPTDSSAPVLLAHGLSDPTTGAYELALGTYESEVTRIVVAEDSGATGPGDPVLPDLTARVIPG